MKGRGHLPLLILDFDLAVVNRIRGFHLKGDCLASDGLDLCMSKLGPDSMKEAPTRAVTVHRTLANMASLKSCMECRVKE